MIQNTFMPSPNKSVLVTGTNVIVNDQNICGNLYKAFSTPQYPISYGAVNEADVNHTTFNVANFHQMLDFVI